MQTLEEIARIAGVSRSTVSRVINQDPNVNDETRKRVQEVIQATGFQPNRAARRLAGGRTRVLGLVIPQAVARLFTDPYFPTLIQGVTSACNNHDHTVMLWLAEPEHERRMISQILHNGLADGIIVSSMHTDDPIIQALRDSSLPFILIGRHPTDDSICWVDVDNYNGAFNAVNYLLRKGCRRVATITGPQSMVVGQDRLAGYQAALRKRGLVVDDRLIAYGDFSENSGYDGAKKLLSHSPDAIFCASDPMAMGAMHFLQESGLKIPEDVAIIGFDDIPTAERANPPLTTIRQPIHRLGTLAVETLIQRIENREEAPCSSVLPTELMIRASA